MAKRVKAKAFNFIFRNGISTSVSTVRSVEKNGVIAKPIRWGHNDKLPHEIIALIKESPTLRRCLAKIDNFIQADGFADPEAAKIQVNPKQTADDVLNQVSNDAANFGGAFALRVKYNNANEPAEAYYVPLQTMRRLDNGQFLVNPTMGTKAYKKDQDQILDPFDPSETPEAKAKIKAMLSEIKLDANGNPVEGGQLGQLYFYYRKTGLTSDYPEPEYLAGREDIETDAQIPKSDNKTVKKNFRPSVIVEIMGEIDDVTKDENGKTDWDYIEETVKEITDPENECEAIVINTPTKEIGIKLHSFDSKAMLTAMDPKRLTIAEAVCRHTGIHSALVFKTAGQLGQSQEILNLIEMQQAEVNPIQRQITRAFSMIFPKDEKGQEINWTISTYTPIKSVPDKVWDVMTPEEKRNVAGLPEIDKPKDNKTQKTLNALSSLSPLVANAVLKELSSEEIRSLVGLKGAKPTESQETDNTADTENNTELKAA